MKALQFQIIVLSGNWQKITQGKASFQNPTEAVLQDEYHQKHYLLVAPQSKDEIFY